MCLFAFLVLVPCITLAYQTETKENQTDRYVFLVDVRQDEQRTYLTLDELVMELNSSSVSIETIDILSTMDDGSSDVNNSTSRKNIHPDDDPLVKAFRHVEKHLEEQQSEGMICLQKFFVFLSASTDLGSNLKTLKSEAKLLRKANIQVMEIWFNKNGTSVASPLISNHSLFVKRNEENKLADTIVDTIVNFKNDIAVCCPRMSNQSLIISNCSREVGKQCNYTCVDGYQTLSFVSSLSCLPDGKWSVSEKKLCLPTTFQFHLTSALMGALPGFGLAVILLVAFLILWHKARRRNALYNIEKSLSLRSSRRSEQIDRRTGYIDQESAIGTRSPVQTQQHNGIAHQEYANISGPTNSVNVTYDYATNSTEHSKLGNSRKSEDPMEDENDTQGSTTTTDDDYENMDDIPVKSSDEGRKRFRRSHKFKRSLRSSRKWRRFNSDPGKRSSAASYINNEEVLVRSMKESIIENETVHLLGVAKSKEIEVHREKYTDAKSALPACKKEATNKCQDEGTDPNEDYQNVSAKRDEKQKQSGGKKVMGKEENLSSSFPGDTFDGYEKATFLGNEDYENAMKKVEESAEKYHTAKSFHTLPREKYCTAESSVSVLREKYSIKESSMPIPSGSKVLTKVKKGSIDATNGKENTTESQEEYTTMKYVDAKSAITTSSSITRTGNGDQKDRCENEDYQNVKERIKCMDAKIATLKKTNLSEGKNDISSSDENEDYMNMTDTPDYTNLKLKK